MDKEVELEKVKSKPIEYLRLFLIGHVPGFFDDLEPRSSQSPVHLLAAIDDHMHGAKLAGAGGGGYMMIIAKDAAAATTIRHELTRFSRKTAGEVVNASVNEVGLAVTRGGSTY